MKEWAGHSSLIKGYMGSPTVALLVRNYCLKHTSISATKLDAHFDIKILPQDKKGKSCGKKVKFTYQNVQTKVGSRNITLVLTQTHCDLAKWAFTTPLHSFRVRWTSVNSGRPEKGEDKHFLPHWPSQLELSFFFHRRDGLTWHFLALCVTLYVRYWTVLPPTHLMINLGLPDDKFGFTFIFHK